MTYEYSIATTYVGLTTLKAQGISRWPRQSFQPYVDERDAGGGGIIVVGTARERWTWDLICRADWNILYNYRTGATTPVFIRTKDELDAWHSYSALMIWPGNVDWVVTKAFKFSIEFHNLVLQS